MKDYERSATTYEQLVRVCPNVEDYRIYQAQSLFKAGAHEEAGRVISKINSSSSQKNNNNQHRISLLHANIKYEQDELIGCKEELDGGCLSDDPDTICSYAAISFKEEKYQDAIEKYTDAMNTVGFQPDVAYNIALCHYMLSDYEKAIEFITKIVDKGVEQYPELFRYTGSNVISSPTNKNNRLTSPLEMSVTNTAATVGELKNLQDAYLIEAFNLKTAIEFKKKNFEEAQNILQNQLPFRQEKDIDPVTLQNQAITQTMNTINHEEVTSGLRKLNFLLSNPPFPKETFLNLLLLYCQHEYYDPAADIMAENSHLTSSILSKEMYEYLNAIILINTSPEEAYQKFEELSLNRQDKLQKITKELTNPNNSTANKKDDLRNLSKKLEKETEAFIPILMAQARIYWDQGNYELVEQILNMHTEHCSDNNTWKLNLAHALFMQQGNKFKECIPYYEQFIKKDNTNIYDDNDSGNLKEKILDIPAIVLANICVAYIMMNKNEAAETIMKKIEKEEERVSYKDHDKKLFHSCIVNLVIGTLYCEKGNFDFGISRVCKSLDPMDKKLGVDTWFYAKKCLLSLGEYMSKQMLVTTYLRDETMKEILEFLDNAEKHGYNIFTEDHNNMVVGNDGVIGHESSPMDYGNSVACEARQLKLLYLKLCD